MTDNNPYWKAVVADWPGKAFADADLVAFADHVKRVAWQPHLHILSAEQTRRGGGVCASCGAWVEVPA